MANPQPEQRAAVTTPCHCGFSRVNLHLRGWEASEGTRTGPVAEVGAAMRHVEVDRAGAVGVAEDLRQRLQHEACARVRHHLAPMR